MEGNLTFKLESKQMLLKSFLDEIKTNGLRG
jgi:hypothetical protein